MVSRLVDAVPVMTEEVEVLREDQINQSPRGSFDCGSVSYQEHYSPTHEDLVVSVKTRSPSQKDQLIPPSQISHQRTPEQFTSPDESQTCSPYDCGVVKIKEDAEELVNEYQQINFGDTDFLESTWRAVVNESNTIPMLAVATTAVMVHPLIFVAGAGVAAGAFFMGGTLSSLWNTPEEEEEIEESCSDETPVAPMEEEEEDEAVIEEENVVDNEEGNVPAIVVPREFFREKEIQQQNDQEWIQQHFPQLENEILKEREFSGMDAQQFFNVFFADDAPFTYKEFQKKRGDIDIQYGTWREVKKGPSSLCLNASGKVVEHTRERVLKFKTLTKSYFGPSHALATKTQRMCQKSRNVLVLESRTRLEGIPFCDRFQVLERWLVQSSCKNRTLLTVTFEVQFIKSCSFEGQIRKKSSATLNEVVNGWCETAHEALSRTAAQSKRKLFVSENEENEPPKQSDQTKELLAESAQDKNKNQRRHTANGRFEETIQGMDSIEVPHNINKNEEKAPEEEDKVSPKKRSSPGRKLSKRSSRIRMLAKKSFSSFHSQT